MVGGLVDRRTRAWRRRCELVDAFVAELGGRDQISAVLMAKVEAAAELAVVAEMTRAAFMRGAPDVTANDTTRAAAVAARAFSALGIGTRKPKAPSLSEYMASRGKAA